MIQNGKGSKPRPYSIKYTQYCENYDDIFRKKKKDANNNNRLKVAKIHRSNEK